MKSKNYPIGTIKVCTYLVDNLIKKVGYESNFTEFSGFSIRKSEKYCFFKKFGKYFSFVYLRFIHAKCSYKLKKDRQTGLCSEETFKSNTTK